MDSRSENLLETIRSRGTQGQFVDYRCLPAQDAHTSPWPEWIPTPVVST